MTFHAQPTQQCTAISSGLIAIWCSFFFKHASTYVIQGGPIYPFYNHVWLSGDHQVWPSLLVSYFVAWSLIPLLGWNPEKAWLTTIWSLFCFNWRIFQKGNLSAFFFLQCLNIYQLIFYSFHVAFHFLKAGLHNLWKEQFKNVKLCKLLQWVVVFIIYLLYFYYWQQPVGFISQEGYHYNTTYSECQEIYNLLN